jgi:DNA helicase HerA-like ATPase
MRTDVTFLGLVQRVVGARILVEIAEELPSASPIIDGKVHRLGQVGSFVRIPLGFLNLYGVVSQVGASELVHPPEPDAMPIPGRRWLEVQLVGESYANEGFQRGVSVFPTLDDEAHIVTERDLALIYGATGPSMLEIGTLAASESLPARVDLDRLVTRHTAILGSTGSGKSNSVACFLKAMTDGAYPSARVVVIDPHGEYRAALQNRARVFSIGDTTYPLTLPYWALSFDELAWFLVDRRTAAESIQDSILRDHIFRQKRECCSELRAGAVDSDEITVDAPIPFSVRQLWYDLDRAERLTYEDMPRAQEALVKEGDPDTLTPAQFKPPGAGSSAPFKPTIQPIMGAYVRKILGRIRDRRFEFLLAPGKCDGRSEDLHDLLSGWIDHEHSITVLDLAGVPFEVMDIVVGVVTRILFEAMFWGRSLPGIGKQRPLLIVFEEAHAYLPRGGASQFVSGYAATAVRRVFREGRKYGVGAIVVSQRPSDLDETILSQCGTFIALRLANSDDQSRVRSTVPDSLAGLTELLPALRTGEALVLGEAVQIPSRVRFPLVDPRPASDDPEVVKRWQEKRHADVPYDLATSGWRVQRTLSLQNEGKKDG